MEILNKSQLIASPLASCLLPPPSPTMEQPGFSFRDDDTWLREARVLPIQDADELAARAERAYRDLPDPLSNEDTAVALYKLLEAGLIVEQAEETWSLPHFICASILNYSQINQQPSRHQFFIELSTEASIAVRIPSQSRLILNRLAVCLRINIYLFSSRKKAQLFKFEGASRSVALFQRIDSYDQVGEVLVLAPSRLPITDSPMYQARAGLAPVTDIKPAVFRNTERKYTRHGETVEIPGEDARQILIIAWYVVASN